MFVIPLLIIACPSPHSLNKYNVVKLQTMALLTNNNYTPPHTTLAHHQIDELIRGTYQHARYIYILYIYAGHINMLKSGST